MIDHAHFRMMSIADPHHRELSTREHDLLGVAIMSRTWVARFIPAWPRMW
jgi:hypothetical protein